MRLVIACGLNFGPGLSTHSECCKNQWFRNRRLLVTWFSSKMGLMPSSQNVIKINRTQAFGFILGFQPLLQWPTAVGHCVQPGAREVGFSLFFTVFSVMALYLDRILNRNGARPIIENAVKINRKQAFGFILGVQPLLQWPTSVGHCGQPGVTEVGFRLDLYSLFKICVYACVHVCVYMYMYMHI